MASENKDLQNLKLNDSEPCLLSKTVQTQSMSVVNFAS